MSQLSLWLYQDDVDWLYTNNDFKPIHAALIRSIRAKAHGWQMGIIEVYTNFIEADKNTYNYIALLEGYAYIDPKSDAVFISVNKLLEPGDIISLENSNYKVEEIKTILKIQ